MSDIFGRFVVCDFEYEVNGGEYHLQVGDLPRVLCMVAYVLDEHLQHIATIRAWRGEFGTQFPFDLGPDCLFVAYSAWAELTCFMTLGWRFPAHVFDLHTAYLATSNILRPYNPDEIRKRQRKRLPDACRAYGIEGWEQIDKDSIAEDIGNGNWQKYGKEAILTYCEEDCQEIGRAPARDAARPAGTAADRPSTSDLVVRILNQMCSADPGARHADRPRNVERGTGKQSGRYHGVIAPI
jgi:hypothetical protein